MNIPRALLTLTALAASGAQVLLAQADLRAIWGSGPNDIWVVGDRPAALHFDGRAWSEVPFGVSLSGNLNGLWGSGPRDLFAVGEGGMILHYDGRAWSRMTSGTDRWLEAVAGRSATDVYALAQSSNERESPLLLHYDGRAWSAVPLPIPFRGNGIALSGGDVLVAGFVYHDPSPTERRQVGVLARMSAARWTLSGWDGQRVTDPAVGGAGWTAVSAAGTQVMLYGQREDGTPAIAMWSGGAWSLLPPAVSAMGSTRIETAFLAGDGTPVVLYDGPGFARYTGGRWVAVNPQASMMQMMMQQQQNPQQMNPQQMQQMREMMGNPMMMALRMAAFDMSDARRAWGASAGDFYVVTGQGRVTHVVGDQATIAYDASCADPMMAGMNPICQALLQQQMQQNR